jgi:hypothetical protein
MLARALAPQMACGGLAWPQITDRRVRVAEEPEAIHGPFASQQMPFGLSVAEPMNSLVRGRIKHVPAFARLRVVRDGSVVPPPP